MSEHKTVLITGGNSGIGFAAAAQIAATGATVALACRNQIKAMEAKQKILQQTPTADVQLYSLDLASLESITQFAEKFLAEHKQLDVLINNAGAFPTEQQFTKEGYELQFGANYLGHVLLTHLLLPGLKVPEEARIIHLSSIMHNLGRINFDSFRGRKHYFGTAAYAQSKLANALFSAELASRLPKSITSNALHPGGVDSDIYRELPSLVYKMMKLFLISAERAAELITKMALSNEWKGKTGEFKSAHGPMPISSAAKNADLRTKLYEESCKLLHLTPI